MKANIWVGLKILKEFLQWLLVTFSYKLRRVYTENVNVDVEICVQQIGKFHVHVSCPHEIPRFLYLKSPLLRK